MRVRGKKNRLPNQSPAFDVDGEQLKSCLNRKYLDRCLRTNDWTIAFPPSCLAIKITQTVGQACIWQSQMPLVGLWQRIREERVKFRRFRWSSSYRRSWLA